MLLSYLPSPSTAKKLSLNKLPKRLGIPRLSLQKTFKKLKTERAALEGLNTSDDSVVFSQVDEEKGLGKKDELSKRIIVKYIVNHPNVIHLPIMNDTILVQDPTDSSKKIKENKLLLQNPVRKLHSDLIAEVPECTSSEGKVIIIT